MIPEDEPVQAEKTKSLPKSYNNVRPISLLGNIIPA